MNYTQNHHLPQWIKSDRIMMDDFNQMCRDLEAGLTANAQAAAAAHSAASSAQSTANAASQKQYAVGTYTGTGADYTVNLGFRPSFVIINGLKEGAGQDYIPKFGAYACATAGSGTVSHCIRFNSNGFTALEYPARMPDLTDSGRTYEYIAFK